MNTNVPIKKEVQLKECTTRKGKSFEDLNSYTFMDN